MSTTNRVVTVRELGGEIWAEIMHVTWQGSLSERQHTADLQAFVDVAVGTLARHVGQVIENDLDLPVAPLPRRDLGKIGGKEG